MTDVMVKVDSEVTRLVVDYPPPTLTQQGDPQASAIVMGNDALIVVDVSSSGIARDQGSPTLLVHGGQQGLKGDKGDQGATGSDKEYAHHQMIAASVWTVNHGLGKYPAVTVVDSAGSRVYGREDYPNSSTVVLTFNTAFSGVAYCN